MSFSISVIFNGNCREAVTFYASVFEQDNPAFVTYADRPLNKGFQVSDKMKSRVMKADLNIEGTLVEFCDTADAFGFDRGNGVCLNITYKDLEKANIIFDRLSQEGQVEIPFNNICKDKYYGRVEDKFRTSWVITV